MAAPGVAKTLMLNPKHLNNVRTLCENGSRCQGFRGEFKAQTFIPFVAPLAKTQMSSNIFLILIFPGPPIRHLIQFNFIYVAQFTIKLSVGAL